ncbi:MAG: Mrp/NBP35 family ATP-binding protein [Acidobacteria bacterium]|nr:Mrp/NBP35 family ATP-binding protein [Acidobacteriota bacterium]MCB9398205.1 Mrp/NBP35 family ATP-binding protein [Acidobacteriota bacterium]
MDKKQEILKALSQVQDPDLKRDIVSLGFVKKLEVSGDKVSFDVELTTPACPVKDQLREACIAVVNALGYRDIQVNMTAQVRAMQSGPTPIPGVKNVIGFASGKGGVGKSTLALNCALALAQSGARVGLLDADFYGPSLPALINVSDRPAIDEHKRIIPIEKFGLKTLSMGYLVDRTAPVAFRGPMTHKIIQQFLFQTAWGPLDYLIVDLPPGTGDIQLSLTQQTPMVGVVLITTPQKAAWIDARKGFEMFKEAKITTLGLIENMSGYMCRNCSKIHHIFSQGGGEQLAQNLSVPFLGAVPLHPDLPSGIGQGQPLMTREEPKAMLDLFRQLASQVAARASTLQWAQSSSGAMEV